MKIHVLTLGYSYAERVTRTVYRFVQETALADYQVAFYLTDASYPLPSKEENSSELIRFCMESSRDRLFPFDLHLITLDRNHGQDGNLNLAFAQIKPADDDIVALYCPDSRASKPTWLLDMAKAMESPRVGFLTTNVSCTDNALQHQGQVEQINGIPLRRITWTGGYGISAFKGAVINKEKIFQSHEFYGGTEANILMACRKAGFDGFMMTEHDDIRAMEGIHGDYEAWKKEVIVIAGHQISFEDWLKKKYGT